MEQFHFLKVQLRFIHKRFQQEQRRIHVLEVQMEEELKQLQILESN